PRGRATLDVGLPERRLLDLLAAGTPLTEGDLQPEERSAAIGVLRRRGYLADGAPFRLRSEAPSHEIALPEEATLRAVAEESEPVDPEVFSRLERRGLVRVEHTSVKRWSPSEEGRRISLEGAETDRIGALTSEMMRARSWEGRAFRPYDVRAPVPYLTGPRPHPYAAWLEEFEDVLIGLGFQQAEGPLIETEFWNSDLLFMPQDHPARSIHDVLYLEQLEGKSPPPRLAARVAAVHEGRPLPGARRAIGSGWGGAYDPRIASHPVLRSQTTAVSGRFLAANPKPPFRMFSIDRNFRFEALDARHHIEFTQCEGILGEEGVSIRHLVGIFQACAEAIGIREMKIRPSYFPFTEPSIEGYVRHPRLGWLEIFPGGMFRPEVLGPLGIEVPVAAWGIGIARLAMIALGLNDVRELFDDDLRHLEGGVT
ncbi:MAG: phenylalanine--tRNA ligase subunit alpha, partial [Thermoplasmata archaeon]|nr:phenylalanine--tRNA ligase subunit alpha [Thermoplasmata archaeon]